MLIDHADEGEAIMGIAFVKVLQRKLPNHDDAIWAKAREVAAWIHDNELTDEERLAVKVRLSELTGAVSNRAPSQNV
jgi:hypothetical protein